MMLRSPDFPSALLPLNPEWFPGGHLSQIVGTIGIQQGCGLANPSVSATLQYWLCCRCRRLVLPSRGILRTWLRPNWVRTRRGENAGPQPPYSEGGLYKALLNVWWKLGPSRNLGVPQAEGTVEVQSRVFGGRYFVGLQEVPGGSRRCSALRGWPSSRKCRALQPSE